MLGALQPELNGVLADRLDSPLLASTVNFVAAVSGTLLVLAFRPGTRRLLRTVPSWDVPRWTFAAGLGGVLIVLAGAVAVETIGVAIFSVAFFGGQITAGLAVDRLGVGAAGVQHLAPARVQAAALAVGAVVVAQLGRPVGTFAPAMVALVVAAGAASAFQSAGNGRIAAAVRDPFAPTTVNVVVGAVALAVLVPATGDAARAFDGSATWPTEPWLYLGGLLGVAIVLSLAIAAGALGVLRATLAMLAAQLVAAFALDAVLTRDLPTLGAVAGAALVVLAVRRVGAER